MVDEVTVPDVREGWSGACRFQANGMPKKEEASHDTGQLEVGYD